MKKTAAIFLLFALFFGSCSGQKSNKTSGYYGPVKKVITYSCPVEKGKIPADTAGYTMKTTTTYDSLGNKLASNDLYKSSDYTTEILNIYSGTGKNMTFKTKIISGLDSSITERDYKYAWADDYHFSVIEPGRNDSTSLVATTTLDKKFRVMETVYTSGGKIEIVDKHAYSGKDEKRMERIINEGKSKRVINLISVTQEYDAYGNPSVVYSYEDKDKKKITSVSLFKYEYYKQ